MLVKNVILLAFKAIPLFRDFCEIVAIMHRLIINHIVNAIVSFIAGRMDGVWSRCIKKV
jgi:hypothetical protein